MFFLIAFFVFVYIFKFNKNSKTSISSLEINDENFNEKEIYIKNSKKRIRLLSIITVIFMVLMVFVPATLLIIENYQYKSIDKEVFERRMRDVLISVILPMSIFSIILLYFVNVFINNMIKKSYNIIKSLSKGEFTSFYNATKKVSVLNKFFFPIAVKNPYLYVFKFINPQQINIKGIRSIKVTKNTYKGVSYSIFIDGETKCYFKFENDYAIVNYLITEVSAINPNIQWL